MTVEELRAALADLPDWAVVTLSIDCYGLVEVEASGTHYRAGVLAIDAD